MEGFTENSQVEKLRQLLQKRAEVMAVLGQTEEGDQASLRDQVENQIKSNAALLQLAGQHD